MIVHDYSVFKLKINAKFGSMSRFAKEMNMTVEQIFNRLCDNEEWSQDEMFKAATLIDGHPNFIPVYFFTDSEEYKERIAARNNALFQTPQKG